MQATDVSFPILLLNINAINSWTQRQEVAPIGQSVTVTMIFSAPSTRAAIGFTTLNAQHKGGLPPIGFQSF
jgi:hypothetical protein